MPVSCDEFTELSARCEALARLSLHLIALLERQQLIDGDALRAEVRRHQPSGSPYLLRAAQLVEELLRNSTDAAVFHRIRTIGAEDQSNPEADGEE